MCVLLGIFREFPVDPYYEPLAWFMIIKVLNILLYICDNSHLMAAHVFNLLLLASTSDLQPSTAIANQLLDKLV